MTGQICRIAEIGEHGKEVLLQAGKQAARIMLFRRGSKIFAFHNACPHQGRSLNFAPDRFMFTPEGLLVCAHHGASFSLASGACLQGPCAGASLRAIQICIRDDEVWLNEAEAGIVS